MLGDFDLPNLFAPRDEKIEEKIGDLCSMLLVYTKFKPDGMKKRDDLQYYCRLKDNI